MSSLYVFDSSNYHYNILFFHCISLYTNGSGIFNEYLQFFLKMDIAKDIKSIYSKLNVEEPDEHDKVVNRYLFYTSIVNLSLYFHSEHRKDVIKSMS